MERRNAYRPQLQLCMECGRLGPSVTCGCGDLVNWPLESAADWNAQYPLGAPVKYWPVMSPECPVMLSYTRSSAWTLTNGEPLVSIFGVSGGVSLRHCVEIGDFVENDPQDCLPLYVHNLRCMGGCEFSCNGGAGFEEARQLRAIAPRRQFEDHGAGI